MSRTLLRAGALLFAIAILGAATLHAGMTAGCAPRPAATSPVMNAAAPSEPPAPEPTVATTPPEAPPPAPSYDSWRYLPASKAGPFFLPQKADPPPAQAPQQSPRQSKP